jgi:hypothetical protein
MPASTLNIELTPAPEINGKPVRYQSLWLLLRVYYAGHTDHPDLPAYEIRSRFPGKTNGRMIISRAFEDFRDWGIDVGWGWDRTIPTRLLDTRNRSRGPFWLDKKSTRRIKITTGGKKAGLDALAGFLGINKPGQQPPSPLAYAMQDVGYWNNLTQAMRLAKDGFAGTNASGVAEHFQMARLAAHDHFQSALSILKESLALRKQGQIQRSWEALDSLSSFLADDTEDDHESMAAFAAMAGIARAWNLYMTEGTRAAHVEINRLHADGRSRLVVRYNPRVRFEYLNLKALIFRAIALEVDDAPMAERRHAAGQSIAHFSRALRAAYEADSIEAAQDVAANIGLSLWLLWKNALLDAPSGTAETTVQMQSLRWICLSEWICDRFGVGGGSVWNTVFLLRIVRGACSAGPSPTLTQLRRLPPLSVAQVVAGTKPFHTAFSAAKGYTDWSSVIGFTLEEHDSGQARYETLQLANLLLEAIWFYTFEKGLSQPAITATERLAVLLQDLSAPKRRFFKESIRTLPDIVQSVFEEALQDS